MQGPNWPSPSNRELLQSRSWETFKDYGAQIPIPEYNLTGHDWVPDFFGKRSGLKWKT